MTNINLFGLPFSMGSPKTKPIWIAWVVFSIAVTFIWSSLLLYSLYAQSIGRKISLKGKWIPYILGFAICLLYQTCTELQLHQNCVLLNENEDWGFGQVRNCL